MIIALNPQATSYFSEPPPSVPPTPLPPIPPPPPIAPKALVHYENIIVKGVPIGGPPVPDFNEINLKDYLQLYKSSGGTTKTISSPTQRKLVIDDPAIWPNGILK